MVKQDNIVLIGMPGAGKSTVGVVLAKALAWDFIDADLLIQKQAGKKLSDIIAESGISKFIELEGEINSQIAGKNQVIATGGSVVYSSKAMNALSATGTVIYLKLNYKNIRKRLGNFKDRGVVLNKEQTLFDLYKERTPLYEKYADLIVKIYPNASIHKNVDIILEAWNNYITV